MTVSSSQNLSQPTRHSARLLLRTTLLSLASLALSTAVAARQTSVEQHFRLGAQAMHNGHYDEAERQFRLASQAAPELAEAHLDLGLALLREGRSEDAAHELDTATRLDPQAEGAHMFLGISYYQMHRLDEARAALQQEIGIDGSNAQALMWLGVVELAAGHPEKAVTPLDRAAELSPKDLTLLDYRGQAHSQVARDSYAQIYKLDPHSWHVHRLQAELYAEQDRHRDAITEYLAAIQSAPRDADLYETLGEEYRKTSQLDLAQDAYKKELQLSPRNGVAMYNLGSIDIERDNARDGVPLLEEVVKFYANAPVAKYYLGRGLAALNRNDEAVRYLQEAVQGEPSGEIAKRSYYELAHIYRKMQRSTDAQLALSNYLKLKEQMDKQNTKQVEDWEKLNATSTAAPSPQP